jgi:hypothetical protein
MATETDIDSQGVSGSALLSGGIATLLARHSSDSVLRKRPTSWPVGKARL